MYSIKVFVKYDALLMTGEGEVIDMPIRILETPVTVPNEKTLYVSQQETHPGDIHKMECKRSKAYYES
jgi:hypothetical protein